MMARVGYRFVTIGGYVVPALEYRVTDVGRIRLFYLRGGREGGRVMRQVILAGATLLVLSIFTAGGLSLSPPSASAAQQVGEGSCVGVGACEALTGRVGDNSCNGELACRFASGNVADGSCNAPGACQSNAG